MTTTQPGSRPLDAAAGTVVYGSARGTGLLAAVVLGSGIAFLDSTVVNVALPTIGRDLGASFAQLQWVVTGYTLALAAFILVGGSLGDRLGRRRVYVWGIAGFAVTSLLCALAPTADALVAARVLQGVAGALLTPGSLAVIQSSFRPQDRGRAIGTWAGVGAVAPALGPPLGGWLAEVDWRLVFLVNLPLAALALVLTVRFVPESRDATSDGPLDVAGAVLGVLALGGLTAALVGTGGGEGGAVLQAVVPAGAVVAVVAGAGFVWWERRARRPMVPPSLWSSRTFTVANLLTLAVYAALSGLFFFLALQLQTSLGYRPVLAGAAALPSSVLLLLLSSRAGDLATRTGPRLLLLVGPLVAAVGVALLAPLSAGDSYLLHVLPGVLLFGLGLALLVAPLTTTVLAAAPDRLTGTASGVNNAVSRAGGLVAVAALPSLVGLGAQEYADADALTDGYRAAMLVCAGLLVLGGLSALALPRRYADCAPRDERTDGRTGAGTPAP
ncbi:DHA2 family efflux MFS transporter permease subunit [Aquipuribacter hungaricus]|uniref:MFS transporter n=1 Tax=Aquipuribacter hungaricus TaxID=545624 RepID=A0ABV7WMF5_9MICO